MRRNIKVLVYKSNQKRKIKGSVNWTACIPLAAIIGVFWVYAATAQTETPAPTPEPLTPEKVQENVAALKVGLDTLWVVVERWFCSS
jgi:Amt family ammonium transporter